MQEDEHVVREKNAVPMGSCGPGIFNTRAIFNMRQFSYTRVRAPVFTACAQSGKMTTRGVFKRADASVTCTRWTQQVFETDIVENADKWLRKFASAGLARIILHALSFCPR
jgi:hypothetical protein